MSLILQHHLLYPSHNQNDVISIKANQISTTLKQTLSDRPRIPTLSMFQKNQREIESEYYTKSSLNQMDSSMFKSQARSPDSSNQMLTDRLIYLRQERSFAKSPERDFSQKTLPLMIGNSPYNKKERKISKVDLNQYLTYVNDSQLDRQSDNQIHQSFISLIDKQHSEMFPQHHYKSQLRLPALQVNPMKNEKFLIIIATKNNQAAEIAPIRQQTQRQRTVLQDNIQKLNIIKLQNHHQEIYDQTNSQKIAQIKRLIKQLTSNLVKLKDYLNNQKKMFHVVKKLIGMKANLTKLLLNEETELVILPLTELAISKNAQFNENVYDGSDIVNINCYNFSLMKDIQYLIEKTFELNLQIKIQGVNLLESGIIKEYSGIKKRENDTKLHQNGKISSTLLKDYKQIGVQDLRFLTNSMNRYEPHNDVSQMELKLGVFDLISKKTRMVSTSLSKAVKNMNHHYAQSDKFLEGNQPLIET